MDNDKELAAADLESLIEHAKLGGRVGLPDAQVLAAYVRHHLEAGIPMPPVLEQYVIWCLEDHTRMREELPTTGRPPGVTRASDYEIAKFISEQPGTVVAAKLAAEEEFHVSPDTVRNAWRPWLKAVKRLNEEDGPGPTQGG